MWEAGSAIADSDFAEELLSFLRTVGEKAVYACARLGGRLGAITSLFMGSCRVW